MLDKFPETYPYTNKYGYEFTLKEVEDIYKNLCKQVYQMRRSPDDWHMEIVEVLLKTISEYNPKLNVAISFYTKLMIQYRLKEDKRKKVKLNDQEYTVVEVQLDENLTKIDDQDLTDKKSDLYSILRYVERQLGKRHSSYLRAKYMGHKDLDIASSMNLHRNTIAKVRRDVEEILGDL